jgi:hypothetical protein
VSRFIVSSASGSNGEGYGSVLSFSSDGQLLGSFSEDERISDPRGMSIGPENGLAYINSGPDRVLAFNQDGVVVHDSGNISGLDPGGGVFAPDGRFCVTLRRRGTVFAFSPSLDRGTVLLPDNSVPFPRGFGFGSDSRIFLSSGIGPSGEGDNSIAVFAGAGEQVVPRLVDDPKLSPLDLTVSPGGNLVVNSEWPFGAPNAQVSVREYDSSTGELLRVLTPDPRIGFARPRGLRLSIDDDRLYCVGKDHVVAYEYSSGKFLGVRAELSGLNGQAVAVLPN